MKRVAKEENTQDAVKPLIGTKGKAPFYDPNDLHVHVWFVGKLGSEEDPKIPVYNTSKINIKNCVYCKVCHKIKDTFQSTVGDNKDIVVNELKSTLIPKKNKNYIFLKNIMKTSQKVTVTPTTRSMFFFQVSPNEKLFLGVEGIFDDYVKIN